MPKILQLSPEPDTRKEKLQHFCRLHYHYRHHYQHTHDTIIIILLHWQKRCWRLLPVLPHLPYLPKRKFCKKNYKIFYGIFKAQKNNILTGTRAWTKKFQPTLLCIAIAAPTAAPLTIIAPSFSLCVYNHIKYRTTNSMEICDKELLYKNLASLKHADIPTLLFNILIILFLIAFNRSSVLVVLTLLLLLPYQGYTVVVVIIYPNGMFSFSFGSQWKILYKSKWNEKGKGEEKGDCISVKGESYMAAVMTQKLLQGEPYENRVSCCWTSSREREGVGISV